MSSITLTLTGDSSHLHAEYFPAIDLGDGDYVCGLVDFETFNTIPNVDESNNRFYYGYEDSDLYLKYYTDENADDDSELTQIIPLESRKSQETDGKLPLNFIQIPTGSYEVKHLKKYLQTSLALRGVAFDLKANKNTLQCEIFCNQPINFSLPNTIGPLLGFQKNEILKEKTIHVSSSPAHILKVNVIRVQFN